MTIDLHIDQLVLHGINVVDRDDLVLALQMELSRLLSEQGTLTGSSVAARVEGGSFTLTPDMGAEAIGTHVARAIYGGIVAAS